jgi:hypothetical protein
MQTGRVAPELMWPTASLIISRSTPLAQLERQAVRPDHFAP